jgi:hypothetical protein
MVTTMHGCSIVVTLGLADNTTFATTNYLVRMWKLYSCTVVIGRDAANFYGEDDEAAGMTEVVSLIDMLVCYVWVCCDWLIASPSTNGNMYRW